MNGITKIEFELESVCPLLMDKWNDESKAKTDDEFKKEAEKKIYADDKGIYIPSNALKASIRLASSTLGKRMDAKKNRQTIRAGLFFEGNLYIGKKTHDGIQKDIITRGQGEKVTRVPTYRPRIDKWSAKGKATLIGITPNFIQEAMTIAGLRYGLLSYRPDYGRFIIKSFKEVK